jgi:hypothetical protein
MGNPELNFCAEFTSQLPTIRSQYARRERHFSVQLVLPQTVRR